MGTLAKRHGVTAHKNKILFVTVCISATHVLVLRGSTQLQGRINFTLRTLRFIYDTNIS